MLRRLGKEIKRYMNEKIQTCKEVLATAENRLTLGLIILGAGVGIGVGLGGGLIASAYIHTPS